jgi:hypothetical protein
MVRASGGHGHTLLTGLSLLQTVPTLTETIPPSIGIMSTRFMDRNQPDTDYEYVDVISAAEAVVFNTLKLMNCCRILFYIILLTEVCPDIMGIP